MGYGSRLDFSTVRSTLGKIGHTEYRYMPFSSQTTPPQSKRKASKKSFFRETEVRFSFTRVCKHEFMPWLVLRSILESHDFKPIYFLHVVSDWRIMTVSHGQSGYRSSAQKLTGQEARGVLPLLSNCVPLTPCVTMAHCPDEPGTLISLLLSPLSSLCPCVCPFVERL